MLSGHIEGRRQCRRRKFRCSWGLLIRNQLAVLAPDPHDDIESNQYVDDCRARQNTDKHHMPIAKREQRLFQPSGGNDWTIICTGRFYVLMLWWVVVAGEGGGGERAWRETFLGGSQNRVKFVSRPRRCQIRQGCLIQIAQDRLG